MKKLALCLALWLNISNVHAEEELASSTILVVVTYRGFEYYGPFMFPEDAKVFAMDFYEKGSWHLIPLNTVKEI